MQRVAVEEDDDDESTGRLEEKTCGERENRINGERQQCHNEAAQPMLTSRIKSLNISSTS